MRGGVVGGDTPSLITNTDNNLPGARTTTLESETVIRYIYYLFPSSLKVLKNRSISQFHILILTRDSRFGDFFKTNLGRYLCQYIYSSDGRPCVYSRNIYSKSVLFVPFFATRILMRKAEIKSVSVLGLYQAASQELILPLVPFIRRRLKIGILLLLCHHSPFLLARVIPPHIVVLRPYDECKVPRDETKQNLVTTAVVWLIVISVYLYR